MKPVFCVCAIVLCVAGVGLSQEASVSWDGASAEIVALTSNGASTGTWNTADQVWSTSDIFVPAVGNQASFKAAIAQAGTSQYKIAQLNAGGNTVFVGGGGSSPAGAANYAPSPWANLIGFDTTSFDDYFALSSISVTVRNRIAADTLDIRWFVEAGGKTYVSGVVASTTGTGSTTVTLADVRSIEWFAFDKNANIEIGTALGSSVGSPVFTDVDYVGIHQQLTYTALGNWHGAWVDKFSATARFYGAPANASNADPADKLTEVLQDVVLGWASGRFAATHDVYFGTVLADVNDASRTNPRGVLVSQDQTATTYDPPGRLDFGRTYYWRIDEVNAPPTSTIYKGQTWSFTTESIAYPVDGQTITATASSAVPGQGPETTVNGAGLTNDLHASDLPGMWLTAQGSTGPAWIQYQFSKLVQLHQMWVWNHNGLLESMLGFGAKDVTIEYSTDGTNFKTLGTTYQLARAPGQPGYAHNSIVDFGEVAAKYVKLTITSNWGNVMPQYGLSEVRFFAVPVSARAADPAPGATGVSLDATLSWKPGREAAKHNLYLSTNEQAVLDGTAPLVTVTSPSHATSLDLGRTYYWRVDEVNQAKDPASWAGDVWSFSTLPYLVIEDFESYSDEDGKAVWQTWTDGYGTTTNGAQVGNINPPYAERTIIHGGKQAMPLFYDNTSGATYSEAKRTLDSPQNWTLYGIKSLAFYFRGQAANTGQLYVKINNTRVNYPGAATDLARIDWQPCVIDLSKVTSGLQSVTSLTIGVDGAGSKGTLYVDDIRLYPTAELITP